MRTTRFPATAEALPDPSLERILRRVVLFGLLAVVLLPAARGHSAWIGALPLWLLAMPLSSWWALHRFRVPRLRTVSGPMRRRRRGVAQARRQPAPLARPRLARAA